jgi:hypothetical protein
MNITFPDNAGIGKRRIRTLLFLIAACALSVLYVFTENIYAAKLPVYTYNPITLYILTFAAASALFACALTLIAYKSKKLSVIATLAVCAVASASALALGADPIQLLLALAFIPSGIVLSACISNGFEKAHTVVGNAVIMACVFISAIALYVYSTFGEVTRRSIAYIVSVFREAFVSFYSQYSAQAGLSGIDIPATFDMLVIILPAFFCVFVSVVSYIVTTVSRAMILGQGAHSEKLKRWPLKMSRLASVIFIIALIFSMLTFSGTDRLVILTMYNVMIILMPGFFLVGIRTSLLHFRRPSLFSIILGLFVLVSCFSNPILIVFIVASMGALDNLFPMVRAILYGETIKKPDPKS